VQGESKKLERRWVPVGERECFRERKREKGRGPSGEGEGDPSGEGELERERGRKREGTVGVRGYLRALCAPGPPSRGRARVGGRERGR
jgi:hypothetical protein